MAVSPHHIGPAQGRACEHAAQLPEPGLPGVQEVSSRGSDITDAELDAEVLTWANRKVGMLLRVQGSMMRCALLRSVVVWRIAGSAASWDPPHLPPPQGLHPMLRCECRPRSLPAASQGLSGMLRLDGRGCPDVQPPGHQGRSSYGQPVSGGHSFTTTCLTSNPKPQNPTLEPCGCRWRGRGAAAAYEASTTPA